MNQQSPHNPNVPIDSEFVTNLPLFTPLCTLGEALSRSDIPAMSTYPNLHRLVRHKMLPSLSYSGGKPQPYTGVILYKIHAVLASEPLTSSRLVLSPIRARLSDKGTRLSIPGRAQIYNIRDLIGWAELQDVLFYENAPLRGHS